MQTTEHDTIIAPATPLGRSALALVRLDGPDAQRIVAALSGRTGFEPRLATLVTLTEDGEMIDEAIATAFQAPASYTGNDGCEVSLHGAPVIVERFVAACVRRGARIAQPGEFTERAVLNGKLDLVQAEAVAELVAARTQLGAKLALANVQGSLSGAAAALRETLIDVIARLEAALDFAEEGHEFISRDEAVGRVDAALTQLREIGATYERTRAALRGITCVILGLPNSGKSTLLNRLVGRDRAIVTSIPGTTRDLLEETLLIGGIPVKIIDTAGLRDSAEVVESIGVTRARDAARDAEVIIYLVDSGRGLTPSDAEELAALPRDVVMVYTKIDIAAPPPGALAISAATGAGVDLLLRELEVRIAAHWLPPEATPLLMSERQREAVENAVTALEGAKEALVAGATEEVSVAELYRASGALEALVGGISNEQLTDAIFAKFCIGK